MAGYSPKPLVGKLDIKPGYRVLLEAAPPGFPGLLAPLPEGVSLRTSRARQVDAALLFVTSARILAERFPVLAAKLPPAGLLWVAWPKKSSGVATDLTEGVVRTIGLEARLVDVKVCAITETWSGLKFVRRLKDR